MTHSALQEQTQADEQLDAPADKTSAPAVSTLIEFPTPGRAPKPQWRKELSERVREIQQRKALEAAREAEAAAAQSDLLPQAEDSVPAESPSEVAVPPLGLVPPVPVPEVNPVVARALEKLERVRQRTSAPPTRGAGRGRRRSAKDSEPDRPRWPRP